MPDGDAREAGETFVRRDGRALPVDVGAVRFSTPGGRRGKDR